ncbi:MAG: prepilin-type N-terminal cleavage/methylation domain-containing protein [Candidatus Wallbacteria bacterium]
MYFRSNKKKGFSLIELIIALTIMLILVGIAAFFLEDYIYKSKVAKAQQDLDMFGAAINLYDAVESSPFKAYNYNSDGNPNGIFSWYAANVATSAAKWSTMGGTDQAWGDYSKNSLTTLVGTYLKTVPKDPWGSQYVLNTAAGYVASLGTDMKTSPMGNSNGMTEYGRERDIVRYYLGDAVMLSRVEINDVNNNGTIDGGEFVDFIFNKDIQYSGVNNTAFLGADKETDAPTAGITTTALTNATPMRIKDNGRVIRFGYTAGIPLSSINGKWFTVDSAAGKIFDMDPMFNAKADGATPGRTVVSTSNAPRQAKVKIY